MKIPSILFLLLLIGWIAPVGAEEQLNAIAPTQIPWVTRAMKTPGYWIGRIRDPEQTLMSRAEIRAFNKRVRDELKLTKDITRVMNPYDGRGLQEELRQRLVSLREQKLLGAADGFWERMEQSVAVDTVPAAIDLRYGVVTGYAHQRFLPTGQGLYDEPGDIDFDKLQNSALDIGTPVVIVHQSADGQWLYALSELSDGWIRADNVGLCPVEVFEKYSAALKERPLLVIEPKTDIYLDESITRHHDHVRMGTILPLGPGGAEDVRQVQLPDRDAAGQLILKAGYMLSDDTARTYMPFTPRQVIMQAFKRLNAPYGWGGMYGEQDCSRFIQQLYAVFGFRLPRDSGPQSRSGYPAAAFDVDTALDEKRAVLRKQIPGPTVLTMHGHIMLYLGHVDGRPYAIHSFWGYREPTPDGDRVRVVNRVAVSDLDLGEGSQKGSLLQRLTGIMDLRAPAGMEELK